MKIFLFFLLAISAYSQTKVACIGDSITYGAGIKNRIHDCYPSQLQLLLGYDYEVKNFGISARTLLTKGDHPWMHEKQFGIAKDFDPDIVIIKLGTNDTKPHNWQHKDDFKKDFQTLLNAFPRKRIYLCLPVPAFPERWGISQSVISEELIPILKDIAKNKHLQVIDLHTPLLNSPEHFPDKIHPNAAGARVMAEIIYSKISQKPALSISLNSEKKIEIRSTVKAEIRYTTDGSIPSEKSAIYNGDFKFSKDTPVRAAAFKSQECISRQYYNYFHHSKNNWKLVSQSHATKNQANNVLFDSDPDTSWATDKSDFEAILDFGQVESIREITFDKRYRGRKVTKLPAVELLSSLDGKNWQSLKAELKQSHIDFKQFSYLLPSNIQAKFLKIKGQGPFECAEIHISTKKAKTASTLSPVFQTRDAPGYFTHRRHSEILNRVAQNKYDLIMIGDSITHQFGGDLVEKTYPNKGSKHLSSHLGHYKIMNMGFGWDRTENVLWRLKTGALHGQSPKYVCLKIGTNNLQFNTEAEIAAGIQACVQQILSTCPETQVILTSILPRKNSTAPNMANLNQINKLSRKYSKQHTQVHFFDLGKNFLNEDGSMKTELYKRDRLHLESAAYEVWAKALKEFLSQL